MTEITVVYDNRSQKPLTSGWGFSCLIRHKGKNILFDTGWNGHLLLENMHLLDIPPETIDTLVLSHQHWDHIGGVAEILHKTEDLDVYVPASFSRNLKNEMSGLANLIEITEMTEIYTGIWSTGELGETVKEQSLVIKGSKGLYVITGCAHPGADTIIAAASRLGTVTGILGGLHTLEDIEVLKELDYVAAGHCTADQEKLQARYPESYVPIYAGYRTEI
jgi:7,8-dihydropterin-6-yl-methyl-4-(beta-D-ribofuranosyl)aminobenzene 5'-phosphate synthase